jgi:hypothetical protein
MEGFGSNSSSCEIEELPVSFSSGATCELFPMVRVVRRVSFITHE